MQTPGVFRRGGAFFDHRILKFLVFPAELLRDGLKTFPDPGFVFLLRILYHIVLIGADNIPLDLQHFVHPLRVHKGLHGVRHAADNRILQEQLSHAAVQGLRDRSFLFQTFLQHFNDRIGNPVGPQKFLKVQRIHIDHGFRTDRNGFRLFPIPFHSQQGTGSDHVVTPIRPKKFQRGSGFRAFLNLVQNQDCASALKYRFSSQKSGQHHHDCIHIQGPGKYGGIVRVFIKIQIHDMFVIFLRKIKDRKRLAALSAALDDQRFAILRGFPVLQLLLYFSFQHAPSASFFPFSYSIV